MIKRTSRKNKTNKKQERKIRWEYVPAMKEMLLKNIKMEQDICYFSCDTLFRQ